MAGNLSEKEIRKLFNNALKKIDDTPVPLIEESTPKYDNWWVKDGYWYLQMPCTDNWIITKEE